MEMESLSAGSANRDKVHERSRFSDVSNIILIMSRGREREGEIEIKCGGD